VSMNSEETCFVCRKHRGELEMPGGVVYEDDLVYVSHGTMKRNGLTYPGIFFVEPRRHLPTMAELNRPESERIGWLASVVAKALTREGAERSYLQVLGHHVPHLHVWIVPRYPETPVEYFGIRVLEWESGPRKSWQQIAELCGRVSAYVRNEVAA
jgi:histidine triad (HIT) family protein